MAEPRALIFDFGGTLDADGVPWETRCFEAYRTTGGELDETRFRTAFRASDRELERSGAVRGLGLTAMVEIEFELMNEIEPEAKADVRRASALFCGNSRTVVRRNLPMLARLGRKFSLGIVSNFTGNLHECLVELELADLFIVALDSLIVGVEKPNPAIFTRALDELGVAPNHAWMIGDNPDRDIRAAAALGLSTAWIAPAARAMPTGLAPTVRISSLLELEGAVK